MKKVINLSLFMVVVAMNILAANGILGSITTKAVSDLNYSVLTPVGFSFSIWGIIYLGMGILVLIQSRQKETDITQAFDYYFMASCILNIAWIIAWQFRMIVLSFILIVMLLISLLLVLFNTTKFSILKSAPIGLYAGWINIAMFANLGAMIGLTQSVWALLILALAFVQIMFVAISSDNVFYALGASWGIIGIAIANRTNNSTLFITAIVFATLITIGSVVLKYTNRYSRRYSAL